MSCRPHRPILPVFLLQGALSLFLLAVSLSEASCEPTVHQSEPSSPARALSTSQDDSLNLKNADLALYGGFRFGGGNWRAPSFENRRPIDQSGFWLSGHFQMPGFWLRGGLKANQAKLRVPEDTRLSKLRIPTLHFDAQVIGSVARGELGGFGLGAFVNLLQRRLKVEENRRPSEEAPSLEISSATRAGGLLAIHSNLSPPGRFIITGGGYVERQTTETSEPLPSTIAGVLVGLRADIPLGSRVAIHLRGQGGRWVWTSASTASPSDEIPTSAAGRLLKGNHWDATARLSIDLTSGVGIFAGINTTRREQIIRFRIEESDDFPSETLDTSTNFFATLSGIVGLSLTSH